MYEEQEIDPNLVIEKYKAQDGKIAQRKWMLGKLIGKGSFASCFEITSCETKITYACKLIKKKSLKSHD